MEPDDFDNWLAGGGTGQTPVEIGKDLFNNRLGCASCHAGGANQRGAKLEGIWGTNVKLVNGQSVKVDEEYVRNSILNPSGQVVEGFQPIMPTFKGQVSEEQLVALVAYIKSLSNAQPNTAPMSNPAPATPASNTNTTAKTAAANSNK